jgi:Uma2 family endonuclease
MATDLKTRLYTTEELLAMPDDGVERWLIRGQLREKTTLLSEKPMTVRNRFHSRIMARISQLLMNWLDKQSEPQGQVLCGEAGCRLRRNPDTAVGIDVAYVAADVVKQQGEDTTIIDGVPVLAVEILSPSDTVEEIKEKIDDYLAAGVALVWIVDPHDQTVTVYRKGARPELVNVDQELKAEPSLPGFCVKAAEVFA